MVLLMLSTFALGQPPAEVVTTQEVDNAIADVTALTPADDPQRARLLALYNNTREALNDRDEFLDAREKFAKARSVAAKEAIAIGATLVERDVVPAALADSTSLPELEQQVQLSRAEVAESKNRLDEIRAEINSMPQRAAQIRARLTELGSLIPDLQSGRASLTQDEESDSINEASIWLAQAQSAKAALLYSQTADFYFDGAGTPGAEKRATYLA